MGNPSEGKLLVCIADVTNYGWAPIGKTHMTVYGRSFFGRQFHKLLHQKNRFRSMPSEVVFFLHEIIWYLLPFSVNLLIAFILLVKIDLTILLPRSINTANKSPLFEG